MYQTTLIAITNRISGYGDCFSPMIHRWIMTTGIRTAKNLVYARQPEHEPTGLHYIINVDEYLAKFKAPNPSSS